MAQKNSALALYILVSHFVRLRCPEHSWRDFYASDLIFNSGPAADESPSADGLPAPHAGTSWFADARAEQRTAAYLALLQPSLSRARTTFLDLGTGNGEMLRALRRRGWKGTMVGVDYCAESVELARRLEERSEGDEGDCDEDSEEDEDGEDSAGEAGQDDDAAAPPIAFYEYDILHSDPVAAPWLPTASEGFDIVLDKGTFDAVSLSSETDAAGQRACEGYAARVRPLVRRGGLALVTSCNWTEEELVDWFVRETEGRADGEANDGFEVAGRVEYPRFKFGGREGQSVVGVCFRRRNA